jgi:hypothetical protein
VAILAALRWYGMSKSVTLIVMGRSSVIASWLRRNAAWVVCATLMSGCFGGQSGGESDGSLHDEPEAPAACACIAQGMHAVHARLTRLDGGCAELVVVELLGDTLPDEYMSLHVGDAFGGMIVPLCADGPEIDADDDVFALFTRGTQDSATCSEYRACSTDRCGDPNALGTTTISEECRNRQAKDPSVDCPPITISEENSIVEYDRCDTECLEETREVCMTHSRDTQLGGVVTVAPWDQGVVSYYWAGEQRRESFSTLMSPECQARHYALWSETYVEQLANQSNDNDGRDVTAAPANPPTPPTCPLPTGN